MTFEALHLRLKDQADFGLNVVALKELGTNRLRNGLLSLRNYNITGSQSPNVKGDYSSKWCYFGTFTTT